MIKGKDEFEIIKYPRIDNINIFFVNLINRSTHLHQDMEFCFFMSGKMLIKTIDGEFTADEGSLHFFNSNDPHSLRRLNGNPSLLSIQISRKIFRNIFPSFENIHFNGGNILKNLTGKSQKQIKSDLFQISRNYFQGGFGFELPLTTGILSIFSRMIDETKYNLIDHEELIKNRERHMRLSRITSYINENLTEKITLSDLAKEEHLSPTYISHFFSDNFDITFQEYLSDRRFEKAEKLIIRTNLPLLDICLESGFSDRKYMNKAFLRNCGCLPKEYRQLIQEREEIVRSKHVRGNSLNNQYIYHDDEEITEMLERLGRVIKSSNKEQ